MKTQFKRTLCKSNFKRVHLLLAFSSTVISLFCYSCPPVKVSKTPPPSALNKKTAKKISTDKNLWARIPAGEFVMGSSRRKPDGKRQWTDKRIKHDCETPRTVKLTRDFLLKKTEVTQGEFESVMGYNPAIPSSVAIREKYALMGEENRKLIVFGENYPVTNVSWHEAAAFCNALSSAVGLPKCYRCRGKKSDVKCEFFLETFSSLYECYGYRLPTEAEWEYAARASTTTDTYNGNLKIKDRFFHKSDNHKYDPVLEPIAWYYANSGGRPNEVGLKMPNEWGLYDMVGNVIEWCHDWHKDVERVDSTDPWGAREGDGKILRGSSFLSPRWVLFVSYCDDGRTPPGRTSYDWGFRPARTIQQELISVEN